MLIKREQFLRAEDIAKFLSSSSPKAQTSKKMAFPHSFFHLFPLLFLLPPLISSSSSSITLPLSFIPPNSPPNLYQSLSQLASISLARAHHIKTPNKSPPHLSTTPLQPHSYGGYSISLKFGNPPQEIQFIMDTASDFVWFPCTRKYLCKNCSDSVISPYIPKKSSSVKIVGCLNPKCGWIHKKSDAQTLCQDCENPKNCSLQICPPYIIEYGLGTTSGIALVEDLDLPNKKVPNFFVGCSLISYHAPAGIAGFGRGLSSLITQLGIKKFSYCMISHKFDDSGKSSLLVLDSDSNSDKNLSYTPFIKNPLILGKDALSVYYYVGLRAISVGGKKVKIPYENLVPDSEGKGGTIVDSGSTFSYLGNPIFELVSNEIIKKVKGYKRDENVEVLTGLKPCFDLSGVKDVVLPEVKFHFKGGANMVLPLSNYFSLVGENEVVCLTMVTDNFGSIKNSGPSIILGNYQMQNFHLEYDLKHERFGFRQQFCK